MTVAPGQDANGGEDEMSALTRRAWEAARRGRLEELEACLLKLGLSDPDEAHQLAEQLRPLARCVRAHPTYRRGIEQAAS